MRRALTTWLRVPRGSVHVLTGPTVGATTPSTDMHTALTPRR